MRLSFLAFAFLACCACVTGRAQQQETDVAEKLQSRNVNVAPILFQNKKFSDGLSYNGTRSANVGSFYFIDHVRTRDFLTGSFYGQNDFWAGRFKFDTNSANISSRTTNLAKPFEVKTSETKTARESGKESPTRPFQTREFRARGRSQDRFDKDGVKALQGPVPLGLEGNLHPMTIDEVRELLNKNK